MGDRCCVRLESGRKCRNKAEREVDAFEDERDAINDFLNQLEPSDCDHDSVDEGLVHTTWRAAFEAGRKSVDDDRIRREAAEQERERCVAILAHECDPEDAACEGCILQAEIRSLGDSTNTPPAKRDDERFCELHPDCNVSNCDTPPALEEK